MEEFLSQSRYLNNDQYGSFLFLFLKECEDLKDLEKNQEFLSQIIYLCTEILIINQDRIESVWKEFTFFLKILINCENNNDNIETNEELNGNLKNFYENLQKIKIKKKNKKFFLTTFSKYCLLKLCFLFLHKSDSLFLFDNLLQEGLKFLGDCSSELLSDIFQEIQKFLHSDLIVDK